MNKGPFYFSVSGLSKTWTDGINTGFTVNFSFECEKSTMTAIVGPSGCGKSTVLKMIAGLIPSDPGTGGDGALSFPCIKLDGQDITRTPPGKRNIGLVFQQPALFPHMRTDDNVAYGLRCRGIGKKESRRLAGIFLERVGLHNFGSRNPASLSGGEAQRVSLARTLILSPKLVLFDEPLSALDAPLRRRLAADIKAMQEQTGFTGLFVTHDIEEAKTVASRIIEMKDGDIVRDCPALEYEN